ncbi:MAG: M1 family peptidase, partial [Spirosomaceae bacterium]|nr:M1 family peptidase [Spirosomataceae bacterium]
RYPAEIWRTNDAEITKTVATAKRVKKFILDPFFEIADIDESDNMFPREPAQPTKFELFKRGSFNRTNPMQEAKKTQGAATGTY